MAVKTRGFNRPGYRRVNDVGQPAASGAVTEVTCPAFDEEGDTLLGFIRLAKIALTDEHQRIALSMLDVLGQVEGGVKYVSAHQARLIGQKLVEMADAIDGDARRAWRIARFQELQTRPKAELRTMVTGRGLSPVTMKGRAMTYQELATAILDHDGVPEDA